ncbi:hypothetical protein [Desulfosarcina sp.]
MSRQFINELSHRDGRWISVKRRVEASPHLIEPGPRVLSGPAQSMGNSA